MRVERELMRGAGPAAVLKLLGSGAMYGYELIEALAARPAGGLARGQSRLYPLLSVPGLKLLHRKMYLRALDLYASHPMDFEDALIVAEMERRKIKQVYSYDRDLDRAATVDRLEP